MALIAMIMKTPPANSRYVGTLMVMEFGTQTGIPKKRKTTNTAPKEPIPQKWKLKIPKD
jgi:hypothetical protein